MKRSEMKSGEPACSALRGYQVAARVVVEMLDDAARRKPAKASYRMQRLAAYRQGYYDGILAAHCQHALGEYPEQNREAIERVMQNARTQVSARSDDNLE